MPFFLSCYWWNTEDSGKEKRREGEGEHSGGKGQKKLKLEEWYLLYLFCSIYYVLLCLCHLTYFSRLAFPYLRPLYTSIAISRSPHSDLKLTILTFIHLSLSSSHQRFSQSVRLLSSEWRQKILLPLIVLLCTLWRSTIDENILRLRCCAERVPSINFMPASLARPYISIERNALHFNSTRHDATRHQLQRSISACIVFYIYLPIK